MGIILDLSDSRSELQQKLDAELRAKANARSNVEADGIEIEKMAYLKGTKKTTTLAPVWLLIFVMSVIVIAMAIYFSRLS